MIREGSLPANWQAGGSSALGSCLLTSHGPTPLLRIFSLPFFFTSFFTLFSYKAPSRPHHLCSSSSPLNISSGFEGLQHLRASFTITRPHIGSLLRALGQDLVHPRNPFSFVTAMSSGYKDQEKLRDALALAQSFRSGESKGKKYGNKDTTFVKGMLFLFAINLHIEDLLGSRQPRAR